MNLVNLELTEHLDCLEDQEKEANLDQRDLLDQQGHLGFLDRKARLVIEDNLVREVNRAPLVQQEPPANLALKVHVVYQGYLANQVPLGNLV